MIRKRTLFVLGAGASAELQMPVGEGLRLAISNCFEFNENDPLTRLRSNGMILQAIAESCGHDQNKMLEYVGAAKRLRRALAASKSIDDTLSLRREDPLSILCGKSAIVASILNAESKSLLKLDNQSRPDLELSRSTWYYRLFSAMVDGRSNHHSILENISFIDFNYDRCISCYLANALGDVYPGCQDATSFVDSNLEIVHPYGWLGSLASRTNPSFGDQPQNILPISQKILTYSEQVRDEALIDQMGSMLRSAQCIIFLGFAFHEQNVRLLKLAADHKLSNVEAAYATSYGMAHDEASYKQDLIKDTLGLSQISFDPNKSDIFLSRHTYQLWYK